MAQSHFLRGGHAINLHEMQLLVCIIILALLGCVDHVGRVFKDLCKAKEAKPHIFRPFLRLVKRHTSIRGSAAAENRLYSQAVVYRLVYTMFLVHFVPCCCCCFADGTPPE